MDINQIASILIYAAMFCFLYACINPHGIGLIRLSRLSKDLKKAAVALADRSYCNTLKRQIRGGNVNAADELFSTKVLSEQIAQYCESIYYMELNPSDKCRTDIDEYINHELLRQQGRVDLCEHAASGLTALGLLGTFLGMAFGLTSFGRGNSELIINGISGLLDGMNLAFLTSIFGIILSLLLGTALRLILAAAESNLELFLDRFRSNVMRNQSEAALNEIISHIVSIESSLNTSNELQLSSLNKIAKAFVKNLNNEMELQIGFLRSAIQDMSKEQRAHVNAMQKLTTQMHNMSQTLQGVSNGFRPIQEQSGILAEQITSANDALRSSVEEIHALLAVDASTLSKHQELTEELLRTADAMKNMTATVQDQSAAVSRHYQNLADGNKAVMDNCMTHFAQTSNVVVDELMKRSTSNMNALQNHAKELLRHMYQNEISEAKIDSLIRQNQSIIEQQAQLIQILDRAVPKAKHIWTRRNNK